MQDTNTATTPDVRRNQKVTNRESDRSVAIYTGYVVTALLLIGAMAFHFSTRMLP
ncbi:MAG: hypothetical protein AB7O65_09430 [Candidatus Korobacteraceae bacterium]